MMNHTVAIAVSIAPGSYAANQSVWLENVASNR